MNKSLKKLIREKGYTYRSLGEKIGVPWQTVASWASGKGAPKYDALLKLSDALESSIEELTGGSIIQNSQHQLSEIEVSLLNLFRRLDRADQNDVCATIRVLLRHEKYLITEKKKVA
jgi:transcriptional regulator with XRE-family HTH domain